MEGEKDKFDFDETYKRLKRHAEIKDYSAVIDFIKEKNKVYDVMWVDEPENRNLEVLTENHVSYLQWRSVRRNLSGRLNALLERGLMPGNLSPEKAGRHRDLELFNQDYESYRKSLMIFELVPEDVLKQEHPSAHRRMLFLRDIIHKIQIYRHQNGHLHDQVTRIQNS